MQGHAVPGWLRVGPDWLTLEVAARPRSSRHAIVGAGACGLIVALRSPAAEGRANRELIDLIAGAAIVPRSAVTIERGARARHKIVRILAPDPAGVAGRVCAIAGASLGEAKANAGPRR